MRARAAAVSAEWASGEDMGACHSVRAAADSHQPSPRPQQKQREGTEWEEKPAAHADPAAEAEQETVSPENLTCSFDDGAGGQGGQAFGCCYQVHLGLPRPDYDPERSQVVHKIQGYHSHGNDPEIASILKLVASIFKVPAVLATLHNAKQVFVTEEHGGMVPVGTFPWRWSMCSWAQAFKYPQVLVIPDTRNDVRFANSPVVTQAPHIRSFIAAPLISYSGHRLGTLCFADFKPRAFDRSSCILLNGFAELVVRQLEKDMLKEENKALSSTTTQLQSATHHLANTTSHLQNATSRLQRTIDCLDSCVALVDTSRPGFEVCFTNAAWERITGLPRDAAEGSTLSELMLLPCGAILPSEQEVEKAMHLQNFVVQGARLRPSNQERTYTLSFRPATRQMMDECTIPFNVPPFLPLDGGQDQTQHFYFMSVEPSCSHHRRSGSSVPVLRVLNTNSRGSCAETSRIDGLQLSHMLGRGSFGIVYYGMWFGTPVAVKVIDHDIFSMFGSDGAIAEANLAFQLRHPNVVATLFYVVKTVGPPRVSMDTTVNLPNQGDPKADSAQSLTLGEDGFNRPSVNPRWSVIEESAPGTESSLASEDVQAVQQVCAAKKQDDGGAHHTDAPQPPSSKKTSDHTGQPQAPQQAWAHPSVKPKDGQGQAHQAAASLQKSSTDLGTTTNSGNVRIEQPKQTWMILEFCDLGCLQEALDRGWMRQDVTVVDSPPKMEVVLVTSLEVARALAFMHSQNILHCDLSAWNIMLTSNKGEPLRGYTAKVADLGVSKLLFEATAITTETCGTVTHMPPETLTQGVVSKATDVFSLGVVLWQLYTGCRPYAGLRQAVIIDLVANKRRMLQWPRCVPGAFKALADACMSYDRENRPSAAEAAEQLERILKDKACMYEGEL